MSRLNDRINAVLEEARRVTGRVDLHTAVEAVRPSLTEEESDQLLGEALHRRAKECATRGLAALRARSSGAQSELPFKLHTAYALDLDGRYVKQTMDMTRVEVRRAIQIREDQLAADAAHLNELKLAERASAPVWDANPSWTFGRVLGAVVVALDGAPQTGASAA